MPLVGVETQPQSQLLVTAGDKRFAARWLDDYVANTETQKEAEEIDAPLVFAGYGIVALSDRLKRKDVQFAGKGMSI